MIGHYNIWTYFNVFESSRNLLPLRLSDLANIRKPHFTVHHLPKQARAILRADRDEIRSGGGVVVAGQTDGMAVVQLRHFLIE